MISAAACVTVITLFSNWLLPECPSSLFRYAQQTKTLHTGRTDFMIPIRKDRGPARPGFPATGIQLTRV